MTSHGENQRIQSGEIVPVPYPDFDAWDFMSTLEACLNEEWYYRTKLKSTKARKFLEFSRAKGTSPQTAWQRVAIDEEVIEAENDYEEARIALRMQEEALKFVYKGLYQYGAGASSEESDETEDETE